MQLRNANMLALFDYHMFQFLNMAVSRWAPRMYNASCRRYGTVQRPTLAMSRKTVVVERLLRPRVRLDNDVEEQGSWGS